MSFPHAPSGPAATGHPAPDGQTPFASGDLRVETRGIDPVPEPLRYGTPGRLFTVWFAPNLTMTGVFTGTIGVALGLDFTTALVAVVLGTLVGAAPTAYLGTWGSLTGTGQLPLARLAFGRAVAVPGVLQWLSSVAWDALIGLFGGDALARLCGWPFWLGVLVMMVGQGLLGVFGYEAIHRLQKIMTFVLAAAFVALAVRLLDGIHPHHQRLGTRGRPRRGLRAHQHRRTQPRTVLVPVRQRLQPVPAPVRIPPPHVLVHAPRYLGLLRLCADARPVGCVRLHRPDREGCR